MPCEVKRYLDTMTTSKSRGTRSSLGGTLFLSVLPRSIAGILGAALFLGGPACSPRDSGSGAFDLFILTDAGGLGDRGKNDLIWRGCQRFAEETGEPAVKIERGDPANIAEGREQLKAALAAGADAVVVGSGYWQGDVRELARRYNRTKFILVEGREGSGNIKAVNYPVSDTGYLMGVAAAAAVPAGGFGFLAGRENGLTRELAAGYAAGVRSEIPSAIVSTAYLGRNFDSSLDRARARAAAQRMFRNDTGVIFAAAGACNEAIAAEAKDQDKLVIGFESNQNYLERGYVITSLNIRWDEVVFEELTALRDGRFKGGVRSLPISSEYIDYPIDANNRALIPADAIMKIEAARQRLACGRR